MTALLNRITPLLKNAAIWLLTLLPFVALINSSKTLVPAMDGKTLAYRAVAFLVMSLLFILLWDEKEATNLMERLKVLSRDRIFQAVTLSTIFLSLSTLFAYDRYIAFFGNTIRGEGFLTLFAIYALYFSFTTLFTEKHWQRFFVSAGITTIIIFLYQIWQKLEGSLRPGSFLDNPIFLSGYLILSLFAGWYLLVNKKNKDRKIILVFSSVVLLSGFFGILFTQTRGASLSIIAAVCVTLGTLIFFGKEHEIFKISARKIGVILALVGFCLICVFTFTRQSIFWQSLPGFSRLINVEKETSTVTSRLFTLNISAKGFAKNTPMEKLLGWGWDNYQFFWAKNYDAKIFTYDTAIADRAHNKLMDLLIMTGLLGFITYLFLWSFMLKQTFKILRSEFYLGLGLLFILAAYFVHGLFEVETPDILLSFYAIIAFLSQPIIYEKQTASLS